MLNAISLIHHRVQLASPNISILRQCLNEKYFHMILNTKLFLNITLYWSCLYLKSKRKAACLWDTPILLLYFKFPGLGLLA